MAAFETPWTVMASPDAPDTDPSTGTTGGASTSNNNPTFAVFSPPATLSSRSSFQVHQKSPLLVATPPRVTQALSKSFSWLTTANNVMGLLTWSTSDPWQSFLVVAAFWAITLYGSYFLRYTGNLLLVACLIGGMAARQSHATPESTTLDEILATLNMLNGRVEVFLSPLVTLFDIFSSQTTPTTSTTRPALTTLFIRITMITPLWLALGTYPFRIITPKRIVLLVGTLLLSWHSRPAKVSRTLLWRSQTVRTVAELVTGLTLAPAPAPPPLPPRKAAPEGNGKAKEHAAVNTTSASPGVKFTFAIYENQRRWLGVGWTASLFAYERAPWTDEHLQPCPSPQEFQLPQTAPGSGVKWRWVEGEDWEIEGTKGGNGKGGGEKSKRQDIKDKLGGPGTEGEGWWYYDHKWRDGRWGVDGWGKYTRRRKWKRRAELVEAGHEEEEAEGEAEEQPPPSYEEGSREERIDEDEHDDSSTEDGKKTPEGDGEDEGEGERGGRERTLERGAES